MLIKEVSKCCNLTKKAIEYYSEQGLVEPVILENGYRDFSNGDLKILEQVALYRKLGLSIFEIKDILNNPKELRNILHKKAIKLEQEKVKQDILQKLCKGETLDNVKGEINNLEAKSIIIKRLLEMFPSYYGRFISLNFSYYLTGKIETEEQMNAFYEIVDFLDNAPNFDLPKDLQDALEEHTSNFGTDEMNKMILDKQKNIENIDEFMEAHKEMLEQYIKYKKSDEYKNSPANRLMELMREFCSASGYYDKFIPAMRKLSSSYNEYYELSLKANEKLVNNHPEVIE